MAALLISELHIQKFDIDTDETIRQRIASKLKTIPEWIWISDDKRFYALRNQVVSSTNSHKSFDTFVDEHFNGDLSTNPYKLTSTEIAKYWLSEQSPERMSQDHVVDMIILDFKKHKIDMVMVDETVIVDDKPTVVKKIIDDDEKVYNIIVTQFYNRDRKTFQEDLSFLVAANIEQSSSFEKYQTMMTDLVPQPHFEFQEEKVSLFIKTNVKEKEMSLSTIFSNIVCDKNAPLFSYQDLYKVVDDLPFFLSLLDSSKENWTLKGSDAIRGHISHIVGDEKDKSNYSNCYFFFDKTGDDVDKTLMIMVVLSYKANENKKIKKRMVVRRLQNAMSHLFSDSDFDEFDQFEENIVGIAIFPNLSFETILLSDMIMNDRLFSTVMSVDESEQASKKKEGLYTHFFIDKFDGTCDIKSKIADDKNQELKFIKFADLPPGTPFVRVRISFEKNMDIINKFLSILSKLLNYYTKNASSIRRIYNSYGVDTTDKIVAKDDDMKDWKDDDKDDDKDDGLLRKRFPDMFVAGYPSTCGHVIKPIRKKDVEGDEYKTWMRFPLDSETYFSCSHSKNYPFIGVIRNTLSNKDTFPYLPCCFKKYQLDKEKSKLKNYLEGILPQKTTYQQNVIITSKFALNDNFGELPDSISFLFQTIRQVDDGAKFERKGVLDTPFSFLNCVLKGTRNILDESAKDIKDAKDVSKKDKKEEATLMEEYAKLIDYPNLCVASQENPGDTVNDMRRTLRAKEYMDPRRWIRLLEVFYSVKIIIFSKDQKTGHVSIQLPYHDQMHQMHLRWNDPAKSIICIYEHYGSDGDTPRCELIVEKEEKLMMGKKEEIVHNSFIRARLNIDTFYDNMLSQWSYHPYHPYHENTISTIRPFDTLPFLTKKDKQAVDSYGKTRALLIHRHFVILTTPLPPLDLQAISDDNDYDIYQSYDVNDRYIQRFLSQYEPSAITVNSNDDIIELHFSIKDITLTIKTKPFRFDDDKGLTRFTHPLYPSSDQNRITEHIEKTRLASILIEYFLYFFSWYCRDTLITSEQVEANKKGALKKFKDRLIVDERIVYSIPKTSNVSIGVMKANHFMNDDDQFVCDSKESRKRLLYTLYTHLLNHFDSVMSYADQSEIRHFYSSSADYATQTKDTLIVNNLDILQLVNGDVHDTLQLESDFFFMKNELISPTPVQVKKAYTIVKEVNKAQPDVVKEVKKPSLTDAIKKGMRKECVDVENEDECPVRYVLYQSQNDVDIHGSEDETNADVLVYKIDDKLHYDGLVIL